MFLTVLLAVPGLLPAQDPVLATPEAERLRALEAEVRSLAAEQNPPRRRIQTLLTEIARIGRPEAVEVLAGLLPRLPGMGPQGVHAISLVPGPEASAWLRSVVQSRRAEASWRMQAVHCLGHRTAEDLDWMAERVGRERDEDLRARMLSVLLQGEIHGLEKVYLKAARSRDAAEKAAGLRGVARLGLEQGVQAARDALASSDLQVRQAAVEVLAAVGGARAFEELLDTFSDFRSRPIQPAIAQALKAADEPEEIQVLLRKGLENPDEATVLAVIDALAVASWRHPELCGPALLKMLGASRNDVRIAAIRGLVRAKPPGTVEALARRVRSSDPLTRTNALWALAEIGEVPAELEPDLLRFVHDDRPALRLHAVRALRAFDDGESRAAAAAALKDPLWPVRSAAVEALRGMRHAEAVDALVEALQTEEGRVRLEITEALVELTGEDFGPAALSWKGWWADHRPGFVPPTAEEVARRREERERARLAEAGHATGYHGIPVPPGGVVFVLDVSGSMNSPYSGGKTRYEYFAEALEQTLAQLPESTEFGILLFETRVRPWQEKLVPATPENVQKARDFLAYNKPVGATNLHGALRRALEMEGVQTVFLLSDGEPTAGEVVRPNEILADISWANRDRRIVIHTLAAGTAEASFMADLAAANGGRSVDLRNLGRQVRKPPKGAGKGH